MVISLEQNRKRQIMQSVCCLTIVVLVMAAAFLYKEKIENLAATGYLGVFIACFAATSTILLPAPGILVVIQYAQILNPLLVVLVGGVGTALGEMGGYVLGRSGNAIVQVDTTGKIFLLFRKHPKTMVFLFSLIPFPVFDVVGIGAGMTKMNPISFWLSCLIGKIIKMGIYVTIFSATTDYFRTIIAI